MFKNEKTETNKQTNKQLYITGKQTVSLPNVNDK